MFSQEEAFWPPAEFPGNMSGKNHSKLLGRVVPSEEEQIVVGLPVVPGCINSPVDHCNFSKIVLCIKYRERVYSVPVIVSPVIIRIPSPIISVHIPGPVNIIIGRIVEYMIPVNMSVMVVIGLNPSVWIDMVIVVSPIIAFCRVFIPFYMGSGFRSVIIRPVIVRGTDTYWPFVMSYPPGGCLMVPGN